MKTETGINLGITMGCPAGVGPEIIIKTFASRPLWLSADAPFKMLILGDEFILRKAAAILGLDLPIESIRPGDAFLSGAINVYPVSNITADEISWGRETALTGALSYKYISSAIGLCMAGVLSGMITAPIS